MSETANERKWQSWEVDVFAVGLNRKFGIALLNVAAEGDPGEVLRFAHETVGEGNDMFLRLVRPMDLAWFITHVGAKDEIVRALDAEQKAYDNGIGDEEGLPKPFGVKEAKRICKWAVSNWTPRSGDEELLVGEGSKT